MPNNSIHLFSERCVMTYKCSTGLAPEYLARHCMPVSHHRLFLKRPFLPCKARVRCLPIWNPNTYPWILPIQDANQALPCHHPLILSKSSHSSFYIAPLPSTGWYPIIHILTLQMPKPPQSSTPHHICHTLYNQKTVQITLLSILQRHSTHQSHHHSLRPLQAMQILSLHRTCFIPLYNIACLTLYCILLSIDNMEFQLKLHISPCNIGLIIILINTHMLHRHSVIIELSK